MSPTYPLPQHRARSRRLAIGGALLISITSVFLTACERDGTAPEEELLNYVITAGACGDVVLVKQLGADSASAFAVVEASKIVTYGEGAVRLEVSALEVVDEHGIVPAARFYGIHVLDARNGTHLHSVAEVITTEGDLFNLRWCPD